MNRYLLIFCCLHLVSGLFAQKKDLDYFVNQALANSPLLYEYENQLSSLSLDSKILIAGSKPQVNGISNNNFAPVIGGWGYDNAITNGQQLSALVSVSKSVFNKKMISSQLTSLQLQGQLVSTYIKISEQDIKKVIADQYITVYGEQLQLDFNNRINDMLKREDSVLKKLTQDNVYKQTDYLAFVVTRQQQLLSTSQLQIQYTADYAGLNYLAGIVDTVIITLPDPKLQSVLLGSFINSAFYQQFELDSLKLANERTLLDVNYLPKVNVFGDAGYYSTFTYKFHKNFGTSIGINILIPLYDGKQKKLQYTKINIQEKNRVFKKNLFTRQRNQQIIQLVQQLNSTEQQISLINKQINYTETLITVNEKLLATGDIRLTDFILALNNYFMTKNLVTQNYISRLKILNQLKYWDK